MAENLKYSRTVLRLVFKDRKSVELKFPDDEPIPKIYHYAIAIPGLIPVCSNFDPNRPPQESKHYRIDRYFELRQVETACGWRYAHYYQINT